MLGHAWIQLTCYDIQTIFSSAGSLTVLDVRPDHFFFWILDCFGSTISRARRMHLRYEKSSIVPSVRTIWKQRLSLCLGCHPTCEQKRKKAWATGSTKKTSLHDTLENEAKLTQSSLSSRTCYTIIIKQGFSP